MKHQPVQMKNDATRKKWSLSTFLTSLGGDWESVAPSKTDKVGLCIVLQKDASEFTQILFNIHNPWSKHSAARTVTQIF